MARTSDFLHRNPSAPLLLLVFILAVAFRVILFFSGRVDIMYETADSWQYLDMARSLLTGTFAEGGVVTMNRTPGYPAFLAAIFTVLGESQIVVTAAQVTVDALTCVMVTHMAVQLRLRKPALILVAFLSITCLYTAAFAFRVMTETVFTFALTLTIWVLAAGGKHDAVAWKRALLSGLMAGGCILVRPAFSIAALIFIFLSALLSMRRLGFRAAMHPRNQPLPILFSTGVLIVTLPWMARNFLTFPEHFRDGHSEQVTLLGVKSGISEWKHLYTKEFNSFLKSYEEPFVQKNIYLAPIVARYVYAEEPKDLKRAFDKLQADITQQRTFKDESLPAFIEIAGKRYAAAPRLYITAPLSKLLKLWISPRIAMLWEGRSGANTGLGFIVIMTLYNTLYIGCGFWGIALGLRHASPITALYCISQIAGLAWIYVVMVPIPTSRAALPLFPLFCLASGASVQHALCWMERRKLSKSP